MEYTLKSDKITLGTCYYPEHWDESLWEDDLRRMLESGIEVVRIAEFAWNKIEPREGEFTYGFFDRFLETAAKAGMKVIFCTPTATPPAWLTEKYPESLNADMNGVLYRHGARRHYNYNSPKYQELCRRIVEKSASHYASHPSVIGWQIDNELNCEKDVFYSESDTIAFRAFLKKQYGTLDALNAAWGTVFWNQTYTDWEEVHVPRTTLSNATNPHEVLDYTRFVSDSVCRFALMQSEIIKKYIKPGDFITTNGIFGNVDSHRMTGESLDFMMYDSYPNFAYCLGTYETENNSSLRDRKWSRNLSEVRSISPNFGIMEQQSGANGWNTGMQAPTPRPGQMTLWTMQSIAHGADFVSYFRWRTCTMGTEIYWHGILDYSGRDNRRLAEVKDIRRMTERLAEAAGSRYLAKVGIVKDYSNIWDAGLDVWHAQVDRVSMEGLFAACEKTHTPFDYCYLDHMDTEELNRYAVLFYPHPVIAVAAHVEKLTEYVRQGGCLVLGCRSGYKEEHGKCVMDKLPGLFRELTGADIPEYTLVPPQDAPVMADWDGAAVEAAAFNDLLAPLSDETKVEAVYAGSYYKGTPALLSRPYGKGRVYYFGGAFPEQTARVFLEKLGVAGPFTGLIELPECCELAVREKDGFLYVFVLQYQDETCEIELKDCMEDMMTGQKVQGKITLAGFETRVFKTRRR